MRSGVSFLISSITASACAAEPESTTMTPSGPTDADVPAGARDHVKVGPKLDDVEAVAHSFVLLGDSDVNRDKRERHDRRTR